jgi:hypothetical protein
MGLGDITQRMHDATARASRFIGLASNRIFTQLTYDFLINQPSGITETEYREHEQEKAAKRAVLTGIVSALGQYIEWGPDAALDLAAAILDDVNAHDQADKVRKMKEIEQ